MKLLPLFIFWYLWFLNFSTGFFASLSVGYGLVLLIADHLNFKVGILGLGVLTTFSSFGVKVLKKA